MTKGFKLYIDFFFFFQSNIKSSLRFRTRFGFQGQRKKYLFPLPFIINSAHCQSKGSPEFMIRIVSEEKRRWQASEWASEALRTIFDTPFAHLHVCVCVWVMCGCVWLCLYACVLVPGEALQQLHTSQWAWRNGGGMHVLVSPFFFHRWENITLQVTQSNAAPYCSAG